MSSPESTGACGSASGQGGSPVSGQGKISAGMSWTQKAGASRVPPMRGFWEGS
jgi:hypothetical protein